MGLVELDKIIERLNQFLGIYLNSNSNLEIGV
jgi:hypothetical protein